MPVRDRGGVEPDEEFEEERPQRAVQAPPRRPEAFGSGRVVPGTKAPLGESGAAKRAQPKRQPRSKRGK
jgi:preprotein translocase subunit SecF